MQPAENKDYSRDVILRLSPTRNTIIVEEQKPGGIAAYSIRIAVPSPQMADEVLLQDVCYGTSM